MHRTNTGIFHTQTLLLSYSYMLYGLPAKCNTLHQTAATEPFLVCTQYCKIHITVHLPKVNLYEEFLTVSKCTYLRYISEATCLGQQDGKGSIL